MPRLIPLIVSVCVLAASLSAQSVLLHEDFASAPPGWNGDFLVGIPGSGLAPPLPSEGLSAVFLTPGTAGTLIMESATFDASKPGGLQVEFDHYFSPVPGDFIGVDIFDGATWNNIYNHSLTFQSGRVTVSTTAANSSPNARLRFRLGSSGNSNWAVDNVKVTNTSGATVESLTRNGPAFTVDPEVDFTVRFDEPVANAAASDFAVNTALSGTAVNDVRSGLGQALEFANVDDRAVASQLGLPILPPVDIRTVEFWVRIDATSTTNPHIFSYAFPGSTNYLLVYNTSIFGFLFNGVTINTGFNLKDGTWHHIAFTVSPGQIATLYIDGDAVVCQAVSSSAIASGGYLVLGDDQDSVGGSFDPNQALIGDLDEVRIWTSMKSTEAIQRDMHRTLSGSESGLFVHWNCDDISSGFLLDDSQDGQNISATLQNGLLPAAPPPFADEYIVEVATGSGTTEGTIGLDVVAGNGIVGRVGPAVPAFTGGEEYTYCGGTPLVPVVTVPGDYSTIQEALENVCANARIEVGPGIYNEKLVFPNFPIELIGLRGATTPVITSTSAGTIVDMTASPTGTRIEGFVITGNPAVGFSRGIRIKSGDVIGCVISNMSSGGAIDVESDGDARIANCVFYGNTVQSFGGTVTGSAVSPPDIRIDGCTFYGNTPASGDDVGVNVNVYGGTVIVTSSIFWGGHESTYLVGPGTISDCCVEDDNLGTFIDAGGNIDSDPLFYNEFAGDFHLRPLSPCIDVGALLYLPAFLNYGTTDADGRDRIFGGRVDMGAYEIDRALLGTSEDLVLETTVNDNGHPLSHLRKVASGGDTLRIRIDSPDGSFVGLPPRIFGQVIPTGAAITPIFPGINLDLSLSIPFVMFDGTNLPPFGSAVLLPTSGLSFLGTMPTGVSGMEFVLQAFVLDTVLPANGIFTSSDSMVLEAQ